MASGALDADKYLVALLDSLVDEDGAVCKPDIAWIRISTCAIVS